LHSGSRDYELNEDATVVATKMMQLLLPSALPVIPGWDVTVHFRLHSAVEGDFYDVILLRDGQLVVAVGKINASGVAGSVMLAIARTVLRSAARQMLAPAEALAHSNDFLCAELSPDHSVSCIYAILEPSTGHLRFANAGSHVPAYCNVGGITLIGSTGIPLGLRLGTTYEPAEVTIAAGGSILFYNHELVNIRNSEGEAFGVNRLHDLITRDRTDGEQLIEAIVSAVQSFAGESSKILQSTVLLVLERKNAQLAA
jgi:serine phosphatase RsbU (regulator of sigma subunit)